MKTNKTGLILLLITFVAVAISCKEDEIDVNNSIFDTTETELTGFDQWIDENFRATYNIRFQYKYEDLESDTDYNLIPASAEKSAQAAQLIKFLWLDAYSEVAGVHFTRKYCPRILMMVGSYAWKSTTKTTGTAESGLKVTLFNINEFDPTDGEKLTESYFQTMHHEFGHILHQTKNYDPTFVNWGAPHYSGSAWSDRTNEQVAPWGFVSRYSLNNEHDDFVEVFSTYITQTDEWWAKWKVLAGEEGWDIIEQKIEFVRDYMEDKWDIDLDQLRSVVRRRTEEVPYFDFLVF